MTRDAVVRLLREHVDELRRLGVLHLALLGAVAKDRSDATRKISIAFDDFDRRRMTILDLVGIAKRVSAILDCEVLIFPRFWLEGADLPDSTDAADVFEVF